MTFLSAFCCCVSSDRHLEKPSHIYQQPHDPQAGFRQSYGTGGDMEAPGIDEPYLSAAPLPRYTPRPINADEKTLAFERQRANSLDSTEYPRDRKNPHECGQEPDSPPPFDPGQIPSRRLDDISSDASSTLSIPSSFGNTSTATTETPPPPYSTTSSKAPSRRSVALSVSTHGTGMTYISLESAEPTSPVDQLAPPQPAAYRSTPTREIPEDGHGEHRRSWESQRSSPLPPLPPTYPKGV
ncbi:hypothetical protein FQN52_009655 [Onygenales sp. PD_12]|nr:hypothetical protein FQN52_009655 [Onygenales sp. PD_12]